LQISLQYKVEWRYTIWSNVGRAGSDG